jgi:hypothetical protein
MALGWTPLPAVAHDRLIAQDAEWWAQAVVMLDPRAR